MSMLMGGSTVLFVPGLRDYVHDHWQTLLAKRVEKSVCVPRLGKANLSCEAWVAALDATFLEIQGPVVLVAHSAGVMMVAHWARRCRRPVEAALLATPPDFETPLPAGYPALAALEANGWIPTPTAPLNFPSIVVASNNDPLARLDRVVDMARAWGSDLVNAGAVGHLNPDAGFGDWPMGATLLETMGVALGPVALETA
jgi:predicted alpha/beta hydrolase family esterase